MIYVVVVYKCIYIYKYHFILHSEFLATTKNMFFFVWGGIVLKKNVPAVYVKCQNHDMWFVDPQNHWNSKWRVLQDNRLTMSVDDGSHQNVWFCLAINGVLPLLNTKTVQKIPCPWPSQWPSPQSLEFTVWTKSSWWFQLICKKKQKRESKWELSPIRVEHLKDIDHWNHHLVTYFTGFQPSKRDPGSLQSVSVFLFGGWKYEKTHRIHGTGINLATFGVFYGFHVGKCTVRPMDPLGNT